MGPGQGQGHGASLVEVPLGSAGSGQSRLPSSPPSSPGEVDDSRNDPRKAIHLLALVGLLACSLSARGHIPKG